MEEQYEKKITWTIKNYYSLQSEKVYSDNFVVGDSKWRLVAYPKGNGDSINKFLSLFLDVPDSKSLPYGWERFTRYRLTVVNQMSEKLSQQNGSQNWFYEKDATLGFSAMLPLAKLVDKNDGFLVNGEVKIVAEVAVDEVYVKSDVLVETLLVNESINVNGFQVLPSQLESVNKLFKKQPDIASKLRLENPHLRTAYLNSLLCLTEIMSQSPEKLSNSDLANACSTLVCLEKAGFKLDWMQKKLKDVGKARLLQLDHDLKELRDLKEEFMLEF